LCARPCAEVTERVLEYRARLLAAVARRLAAGVGLQNVVSIASLDVAGQSKRGGGSGERLRTRPLNAGNRGPQPARRLIDGVEDRGLRIQHSRSFA
jgi:hypothetical protein